MIWPIVIVAGIVIGLLIVAAVIFVVYLNVTTARKDRRVRETGHPILTGLVMANTDLQNPNGSPQLPGLVVFGFYEASPQMVAALQKIAERAFELYRTDHLDTLSPQARQFALTLKDHNYTDDRRHQVPTEISGSLTVYAADLWIYRDRMPNQIGSRTMLACAVTGQAEGEIAHLPLDDPRARSIYSAAAGQR